MAASHFKLDNLNIIIDNNNFQQTGSNEEIMGLSSLKNKWSSFGWNVSTLDGHNIREINDYFDHKETNNKPNALISKTIKGKGFSFSENNNDWHHKIMSKDNYQIALKELEND